jgi:YggT family protein
MGMILSIFFDAVASMLHTLIFIYIFVLIVGSVLSFVNPDPYNPFVQIIQRLTEPVYGKIRKYIPTIYGGIDFAPFVLILALQFIDSFLVKVLFYFSRSLTE